jgi:hypothetical protein
LSYFKENGEWEYQGYSSSSSTGTREGSSTPELTYTLKGDSCNLLKGNNFNKSVYKRIILESNRKYTKFRKTYIKQTLMSMWKAYRHPNPNPNPNPNSNPNYNPLLSYPHCNEMKGYGSCALIITLSDFRGSPK